jgi:hypothetical protein
LNAVCGSSGGHDISRRRSRRIGYFLGLLERWPQPSASDWNRRFDRRTIGPGIVMRPRIPLMIAPAM